MKMRAKPWCEVGTFSCYRASRINVSLCLLETAVLVVLVAYSRERWGEERANEINMSRNVPALRFREMREKVVRAPPRTMR